MKKLLKYMKGYGRECILGPLFKLLEASFELFVPLVMASIIDTGIRNADTPYIFRMGGVLVLLGLIGLTCAITAQYFAAKAAVGFAARIRRALFAHIETLSFREMDEEGTSTLITRMTSDINQVQNGVNLTLRLFLRSPFVVFGAMIMAFTINVRAALIFVVTIPVLSVVVFGVMLVSIPLYRKVQGRLDRVMLRTRENLTGIRVIRAFHREEQEVQEYHQATDALNDIQVFVGRISGLMGPMTFLIVNAATIALLYTGAVQVDQSIITQGQVVALVNYMSQILTELVKLANLIINITKSIACGNRVQAILEKESSLKERAPQTERDDSATFLEFDHVSMAYAGASAESLSDITFSLKRGQTMGIIGGTGSGKSTLVSLIPRFYEVTKGSVRLQGMDVRDYPLAELRDRIGVVMQKALLFSGTIRSNLAWGLPENVDTKSAEAETAMWDALRVSQSEEFVRTKEGALDAEITQGGKNLSGGQRQRLTIARALMKKPELLILDDSASALDYATDAKLRSAIRRMESNPTVIIVSQRTASIRYADQILVLDDGEAVGLGTHEELLANCPVYREIHESQAMSAGGKEAAHEA